MSQLDDVNARVGELEKDAQRVEAALGTARTDIGTLKQQVTDLQAQIDANQPIDLQPVIGRLDAIDQGLEAAAPEATP